MRFFGRLPPKDKKGPHPGGGRASGPPSHRMRPNIFGAFERVPCRRGVFYRRGPVLLKLRLKKPNLSLGLIRDQVHPAQDGEQRLKQDVQRRRLGENGNQILGQAGDEPAQISPTMVLHTEPMAAFTSRLTTALASTRFTTVIRRRKKNRAYTSTPAMVDRV